jgi:hypothetical protein
MDGNGNEAEFHTSIALTSMRVKRNGTRSGNLSRVIATWKSIISTGCMGCKLGLNMYLKAISEIDVKDLARNAI